MKQKLHPTTKTTSPAYDQCQTPNWPVDLLVQYIDRFFVDSAISKRDSLILEPAAGKLRLVHRLQMHGATVDYSDVILKGDFKRDFFTYTDEDVSDYDWIITNPPFSQKFKWLTHCYSLDVPFALLMPLNVLGTVKAQILFSHYGVVVLTLPKRVNYEMPYKGTQGTAHFPSAWFIWHPDVSKTTSLVIGG